ncbi:MAG: hypothetical protein ACE5IR_06080 [bacterium]
MDYHPGNSDDAQQNMGVTASTSSPIADIVSLESVVNLLIQKGLCTPEELFEEERKRKTYQQTVKGVSLVKTRQMLNPAGERKVLRKKQNWLKRKMSKSRWSRKLGTSLFGWQWKKVKLNNKTTHVQNNLS